MRATADAGRYGKASAHDKLYASPHAARGGARAMSWGYMTFSFI